MLMSKLEPPKIAAADDASAPKPAPGGAEAYARWLEHMQRARTRHAAITRNLYSWSNYKTWAEKMRHDWQNEDPKDPQGRAD
jgi:hypothetical protein